MTSIGLALGGGGARGLAHVLALETIDACGYNLSALSGTSMGAIIGAMYASGHSGKQIRQGIEKYLITKNDSVKDVLNKAPNLLKWLGVVSVEMKRGGILKADGFLKYLFSEIGVTTFEELKIPLHVVATDFWTGKQVVINSGELLPAIKASMAIPGLFAPVVIGQQVLVDGGMANNVPYDVLQPSCDITIAIDVAPIRSAHSTTIPNTIDAVLGMFDLLIENAIDTKLKENPPTIYVRPPLNDIKILEFDKIESVFEQSQDAMDELKTQLQALA